LNDRLPCRGRYIASATKLPAPPIIPPVTAQPSPAKTGLSRRRSRVPGHSCTSRDFSVQVRIRDHSRLRYARFFLDGRRSLSTTKKRSPSWSGPCGSAAAGTGSPSRPATSRATAQFGPCGSAAVRG